MPCYCSFLCTFLHYARYFIGKSEHFVIICCWDRDICSTIPELGNVHVKYTAQCRVVIKKYLAARHDQCYLILTHCSYWIQSLCFITLTDMEQEDKDAFITCRRVDNKNSATTLHYHYPLLFYPASTPGGECQEENKEKEIHQLRNGESKFSDKSSF